MPRGLGAPRRQFPAIMRADMLKSPTAMLAMQVVVFLLVVTYSGPLALSGPDITSRILHAILVAWVTFTLGWTFVRHRRVR